MLLMTRPTNLPNINGIKVTHYLNSSYNSNTTYNRRIFDSRSGTGENTIWGFHDKVAGRSYNGNRGWVSTTEYKQSEPNWWIIGIDTEITARYNGMDCTNYYTFQGSPYPIISGLTPSSYPLRPPIGFNPIPTINYGAYTGQTNSNETSDWALSCVIIYDSICLHSKTDSKRLR